MGFGIDIHCDSRLQDFWLEEPHLAKLQLNVHRTCETKQILYSGSHTNPAITLFFYTTGDISLQRLILYVIAQTCGAFCGAAITFLEYYGK